MNFLNELINSTQMNLDPLNFIAVIISVFISIYICRKETATDLIKERHDNLLFPLFDALESVLYQENYDEALKAALEIIKQNKNLADGRLLSLLYYCNINPSKNNFCNLCDYINRAYDKSCRRLGLKTRDLEYRIKRRQFKNFYSEMLYIISYSLFASIAAMIGAALILCALFFLLTLFLSADLKVKTLMFICFAPYLPLLIHYIKHNF